MHCIERLSAPYPLAAQDSRGKGLIHHRNKNIDLKICVTGKQTKIPVSVEISQVTMQDVLGLEIL